MNPFLSDTKNKYIQMKNTNISKLAALVAVTACFTVTVQAQQYTINGNLEDADNKKIWLLKVTGGTKFDTVAAGTVKNGTFRFLGSVPEAYPHAIALEGGRGKLFFLENTNVTVSGKAANMEISGGKAQEAYLRYEAMEKETQQQMNVLRTRQEKQRKDFLAKNGDNVVAAYLLGISLGYMSAGDQEPIYQQFSDAVKKSEFGQLVRDRIDRMTAVMPGKKAPDFQAPTPEGGVKSLSEVVKTGKLTMIDFWASWCGPCRAENPNVVRVYSKYHDKGFNIIGVSLDREGEGEKWKEAIKKDGLVWNHVSDLKFWQSDIARLYNIRSIPATFLVDEKGVIVAKDLRGAELEKKVAEILGKN